MKKHKMAHFLCRMSILDVLIYQAVFFFFNPKQSEKYVGL